MRFGTKRLKVHSNGWPIRVGQNAVLTSWNVLERLRQIFLSLNLFVWFSNTYLMFDQSHGIRMTLECHTNEIFGKSSNSSIRRVL